MKQHALRQTIDKMSWNNIPVPLKEIITQIAEHSIRQELKHFSRKITSNERIIQLQKELHSQQESIILSVLEARASAQELIHREH
jgi:hypothetical protein